jgi:hypothetical protein
MPTPEHFCHILGALMIVSVLAFYLADSRIPYERIGKKIAGLLAIVICLLFILSMFMDFIGKWF